MRFLVDECTGPSVAFWLRDQGHEVFSIYEQARGVSDDAVLLIAVREDRILITNDKDFGEMIFRQNLPHRGIVLLRPDDDRSDTKIELLRHLLTSYATEMTGNFTVVTSDKVRISRPQT